MKAEFQRQLVVRAVGLVQSEIGRVFPGGLVSGLREDASYVLEIIGGERRLFIDDIPLIDRPVGQFAWASSFFAGQVEVVSIDANGGETSYFLQIIPVAQKVREDQFSSMVDTIKQFDQRLLLGETAACLGFGRDGFGGKFDGLVRWQRLRRYGDSFLRYVEVVTRMPHANLKPVRQSLPLAQVKRLPIAALRDKRIFAMATGQFPEGENIDSVQVHVQVPTSTVDTPANRAICALLERFQQALVWSREWVLKQNTELTQTDALARRNRRLGILRAYQTDVRRLLNCHTFRGVKSYQTTAAGLTQVAANPSYARAYRKGIDALRLGVKNDCANEDLRVGPSWGVYETWCYVALVKALELSLGVEFKFGKSKFVGTSSDVVLRAQLAEGRELELLFQATFRFQGTGDTKLAWSISRERRPDIVLVASQGDEHRTMILDAKYRSGRSNVLDAMASAHIYHDSLFLAGRRPDLCLLLLPGGSEVESLEKQETWQSYGVGAISDYSVGSEGIHRCVSAISTWIFSHGAHL